MGIEDFVDAWARKYPETAEKLGVKIGLIDSFVSRFAKRKRGWLRRFDIQGMTPIIGRSSGWAGS